MSAVCPATTAIGDERREAIRGRVLVIDDDPVILRLVRVLLLRHGYDVEFRTEAAAGIERAEQYLPDVVLLDIEMPGLDGIEACKRLRSHNLLARVPVMFFSARAKEQFIGQGFGAGADDYLEKPFTEAELLARVANLTRLARYEQSLRDTAEQLRNKNAILSRELEAARRMQSALLPPSPLAPHPDLRCASLYEPMVEVGGDLFDIACGSDGIVRVLVADVSGHGVMAALLAAYFKMGYQVYSERERSPAGVLLAIHRELCRALDSADYVTAITGWFDPSSGSFRYASAGHVPGLLLRPRTREIQRLAPTGPIIGILEESVFEECEVRLEPADRLLLLTDGIIEAADSAGEMYSLRRVERLAAAHGRSEPSQMLQSLLIDLENFRGSSPPDDDATALMIDWRPAR